MYDKKYYLSEDDLNRVAESAVLAQLATMMYESGKIGYTQFQNTIFECAAHVLNERTLNEDRTRKKCYTSSELNEQLWKKGYFLLNETNAAMSRYQQQMQDRLNGYNYGQARKSQGFGAGVARVFGFDPDAGWSFGNVLNGIITLGSLVAAPFTGGGSLAAGTALRAGLAGAGRAAVSALARNAGKGLMKNALTNVGKRLMTNTGKNVVTNVGKNAVKNATPSLMKGMWTSAGRQALANQAKRNFATSAGRAAIGKAAAKGIGTNLAFVHGSNLLFGQPGNQMYYGNDMQYAQDPYGGGNDIYGLSGYGGNNPYAAYYGMA